jgi:hypothetical protein
MFRYALLALVAFAAADEIHLANCQNTQPGLPADTYSVMVVRMDTIMVINFNHL